MKTAEDIKFEITDYGFPVDHCIELIKEYGRQCAEQALKDAANKYEGIHMRDSFGSTCDVPNAILSTPINTP